MTGSPLPLTQAERRILEVVCDAFCPRVDAGPGEPVILFGTSASDLGVARTVEQAMAALQARQRRELRLFIRLLDNPVFMLAAVRQPHGITAMAPPARECALLALARSPVPQLRTGFQALKRLVTFLFYAVVEENGRNRLWPAIGYDSISPAPATAPLRLTAPGGAATLDADVCVIGSGAGGGVIAGRLAAAGQRVIVLEAGPADQAPDFDQREIVGMQRLYLDEGTTASRDLGVAILAGACIGGGTAINWQTSLRLPDYIRDEWAERSGIADFAGERFTRALDAVCERLHVGTGESARNGNNAPLERGTAALGIPARPMPRNARGCDPAQCGYCVFGCRHGGKQATSVTWLVDAQTQGATTIVANCRAVRLRVAGGAIHGVSARWRDPGTGASHDVRVNAPRVVVAAGALETPALLLRSGIAHPQLGRNLYLHPTTAVSGRYAEPVRGWLGAPQSMLCDAYDRLRGNHGVRIEAAPIHPGLFGMAVPWYGAREHRVRMQHADHASAFVVLSRDRDGGRVRVDPEGRPVIDYRVGRLARELLREGIVRAARIHHAAGALEIHTVHARDYTWRRSNPGHPGKSADGRASEAFEQFCRRVAAAPVHGNRAGVFSAHQMGTCRMGTDRRASVCDANGQVRGTRGLYVADASLFPASSGVNPMITIMAIAHMVADGLAT